MNKVEKTMLSVFSTAIYTGKAVKIGLEPYT